MKTPFTLAVTAAILLTGCAVGPDYHRPAVQMPPAFRAPTAATNARGGILGGSQVVGGIQG